MTAYQELIDQIELFIKRFYTNRLIKGLLVFSAISVFIFLAVVNIEYFGTFSSVARGLLFFVSLATLLALFWFYILDPILKLNKVGKRMSTTEAALLIGKLMPSIQDKIVNTIQLNSLSGESHKQNIDQTNTSLIQAAINQKAIQLTRLPFISTIDFKENKKYLKYVLPIFFILGGFLIFQPQIIRQGSERILNYQNEFIIPAPFEFILASQITEVEEGSDLTILLQLKGTDFPKKLFLQSNYGRFLMTQTAKNEYSLILPKVKKDVQFYFEGGGFTSKNYLTRVFGSSQLNDFKLTIDYPDYTGIANETIENPVFIRVPEGSKLHFSGQIKNVSLLSFLFSDTTYKVTEGAIDVKRTATITEDFNLVLKNKFTSTKSRLEKSIQVIPDAFPFINVSETRDSSTLFLRFFEGEVRDDYGITSISFVADKKDSKGKTHSNRTQLPKTARIGGTFYHVIDLATLGLQAGEELTYYFEVYDNDQINGPKKSVSTRFTYKVPTQNELAEKREESLQDAQTSFSDLLKEMNLFQKNMDEFRKANLDKRMDSWKKKEMLDRLFKQQETLQKNIEKSSNEMKKTMEERNTFDKVDAELLEKQALLEELMEKLMDDEMEQLLKELQELMEKNDNSAIEEKMKEMQLDKDEMNRQMDRSLEMLKKMEVEEKAEKIVSKLEELSKKQEELANETTADEKQKQEELTKEFEKLKEEIKELEEKNKELKRPFDLDTESDLQKEAQEQMKEAQENIDKGKDKKANEPQKKAADKMKEMQQSMKAQMEQQKQQQAGEDIETLRSILQNLIRLSFEQESVLLSMQGKASDDPILTKLTRSQRKLIDDHIVVKDSLIALAKRVPQISGFIDEELKTIDRNFGDMTANMHNRKMRDLGVNQQFVMTSYNNLALMLDESLQQMQQQMQSMMSGNGSCDKPGGSGSKPSEGLSNMKDALKKQLEKMKGEGEKPGEGEKGNKPGGTKPGSGEGMMGIPGMNAKEISKMAAEQAMMRKMLEQMRQDLNKDGKGSGNALNPLIEELERQEKDLVNRNEKFLVKRQQEILTRLLESEKALEEREWDEKRESKTAKNNENRNLIELSQYKKRKELEIEQLRSTTPSLNNYYRQMAVEFFNKVLSND